MPSDLPEIPQNLTRRGALVADELSPTACSLIPTTARPGSAEKIQVMRERNAARMALHHPEDGVWDNPHHETPNWLADTAAARLVAQKERLDHYAQDFDSVVGDMDYDFDGEVHAD